MEIIKDKRNSSPLSGLFVALILAVALIGGVAYLTENEDIWPSEYEDIARVYEQYPGARELIDEAKSDGTITRWEERKIREKVNELRKEAAMGKINGN